VLAVLDGKEEIARPVFLFLVVHMDTVFKPLNVFVILAMAEDFVMFLTVGVAIMDIVLVQMNASVLMVGKVMIAQNVYPWLDVSMENVEISLILVVAALDGKELCVILPFASLLVYMGNVWLAKMVQIISVFVKMVGNLKLAMIVYLIGNVLIKKRMLAHYPTNAIVLKIH